MIALIKGLHRNNEYKNLQFFFGAGIAFPFLGSMHSSFGNFIYFYCTKIQSKFVDIAKKKELKGVKCANIIESLIL